MIKNVKKVRKGLECCIKQIEKDIYCDQLNCPYYNPKMDHARLLCWTKLNKDALKLINDQQEEIQTMLEITKGIINIKGGLHERD